MAIINIYDSGDNRLVTANDLGMCLQGLKAYIDKKSVVDSDTDKNTYATDTADADALVKEIFGTSSSGGTIVPR